MGQRHFNGDTSIHTNSNRKRVDLSSPIHSLPRFDIVPIPVRSASEWVITLFRSDFTTHSASADFVRVDPLAGASSSYFLARNAKMATAFDECPSDR